MALPVIRGIKSANERFAGAEETFCIEAMMQDGKALQAGTSHFLAQNFAKAFDVKYLNKENKLEYVWATSWGVSTRLIGALIMAHSDDNGLVLPPRIAPIEVVIVPIYKTDEQKETVLNYCDDLKKRLEARRMRVKFDDRDTQKPGFKFAEWELKGVPVRIAAGPRDVENNSVEIARRDTLEKSSVTIDGIEDYITNLLEEIQNNIFQKALDFRQSRTVKVDTWEDFKTQIENSMFVYAHWDGTPETEQKIKEETKATIRCIPLDDDYEDGTCIYSGQPSKRRVIFARAY
jgi:prolyl-tRNA synthetase